MPASPLRTAQWKISRYILNYDISDYIFVGMKHIYSHADGFGRRSHRDAASHERASDGADGEKRCRHRGHGSGFGGRRRLFDYGDMRLLVLALLADQPRHGYELIRTIEERMGGSYSPSPGVIYPTLTWLEDMGYATAEAEQNGRKRYRLTDGGQAFLQANQTSVDSLLARFGQSGGRFEGVPAPIVRGMENLKLALRLRLKDGPIADTAVDTIASALDAAARAVEQSR